MEMTLFHFTAHSQVMGQSYKPVREKPKRQEKENWRGEETEKGGERREEWGNGEEKVEEIVGKKQSFERRDRWERSDPTYKVPKQNSICVKRNR